MVGHEFHSRPVKLAQKSITHFLVLKNVHFTLDVVQIIMHGTLLASCRRGIYLGVCKRLIKSCRQCSTAAVVLPKVGGEIFWDDSEWAVKVRHPTIPSSCCRDSPLALICLSESSYSWHPKDGTLILEMRLSSSSLLAGNDPGNTTSKEKLKKGWHSKIHQICKKCVF